VPASDLRTGQPGIAPGGIAPAPGWLPDLAAVHAFFEPRAAAVDAGDAGIRDGLAFLLAGGLAQAGTEGAARLITSVARSDMASAFSAWAHRMVVDYLRHAPAGSWAANQLPGVLAGTAIGATAMAAGTAHYLSGAPLPVTVRRQVAGLRGTGLVLDGSVPWASNLLPPFVAVTAAADADQPGRVLVVAFTDRTPGVTVGRYPDLLALRSTGSASIELRGAELPADAVISDDLARFVGRILPTFLLLQSSFCRGLAGRALDEAEGGGRLPAVLRPDHDRLRTGLERTSARLDRFARRVDQSTTRGSSRARERDGGLLIPLRDLLQLRLRAARLAGDAVRLELAAAGGRGYLRTGATARRLREAAFLPIQAPTEVQLRWTLSRFD